MELINEGMIILDLNLDGKKEVIELIADILKGNHRISSKRAYIDDVYERENLIPTAIGDMIAIPHAVSSAVDHSSLVFLRLNKEIEWTKEEKVKYVFGIAVPKMNKNNEHLNIISMIARNILDKDFKQLIFNTTSKEVCLAKFNECSNQII